MTSAGIKRRSSIQEQLASRRVLLSFFQRHPSVALAETAALCGYDSLILDDEHGILGESDNLQVVRALSFSAMSVFVRLRAHDPQALSRYMDMGVDGFLIPGVSTAEEARKMVRAMVYPPAGTRGFGASAHRATSYGMDMAAHLKDPRAATTLLPIIESALGVTNVEEILALEGVDGVIVGPADLTADLGCPGEFSNPAYVEALGRIERAARAEGKVLGTAPHAGYPLEVLLARGHRFLILGSDTALIRDAMSAQLRDARALYNQTDQANREQS